MESRAPAAESRRTPEGIPDIDRVAVGEPYRLARIHSPEPAMSLPRTVADVLKNHVTLSAECIDRMYLNVYVPRLQTPEAVAHFFRFHRGWRFASSALMDPITKRFVANLEAYAREHQIPVIAF